MRRSRWATLGTIAVTTVAPAAAALRPAAPAPTRLTEAEYLALTDGYEALQSSLLAVLQGVEPAKDMRGAVALVIVGTPRRTPPGECGVALSRYRQVLVAYGLAVERNATYGPPTAVTLSAVERRASRLCRPGR